MTDNREQLSNLLTTALRTLDDDQISHLAYSLLERIPADKWPAGLVKKEEWIDVADRPLVNKTEQGFVVTDMGAGEFLAAVPFVDAKRPGQSLWWIRHCVIENGLCVVGDMDNEPAGWEVEDVTHYMPLPAPPSQLKK